jgi:putative ABC transport system permease protein
VKLKQIILSNTTHYSRYYRLVAIASLITAAVITGSLVVGDSVRGTLVQKVNERLGNTETIVFTQNSFLEDSILTHPLFAGKSQGVLLTNGFVSRMGQLVPVMVWGVSDTTIAKGGAKINEALASELNLAPGEPLVLRLPATGLVPSGSLFVTDNYTTSMRLNQAGITSPKDGGNRSLKNEQSTPFNLFVNRDELATTLDTKNKINLIFHTQIISQQQLHDAWHEGMSGLKKSSKQGVTEITSDQIFLQQEVVERLRADNPSVNRLFSYLVNSLEHQGHAIPYSFATAMDSYRGQPLRDNEILMSDYSAARLQVKVNDTIRVTYYTSKDLKTLRNDTARFVLSRIVPIAEWQADASLSAEFPGLSNVDRCTDWNSDLPIDMQKISDEDENYWKQYGTTPKAIIAYQAVANQWGNAYGNATAMRFEKEPVQLNGLTPDMFGIQIIHPREIGMTAAMNGVDFAGLFLALGFFIVIGALFLMAVPLSEMFFQRANETALLQSLGYSSKRIMQIRWAEAAPVVAIATATGVAVGIGYTLLILWLMESVWKGATHTENFSLIPTLATLAIGLIASLMISLGMLWISIKRSYRQKQNKSTAVAFTRTAKLPFTLVIISALLPVALIALGSFGSQSVALFVFAGVSVLGTAALWGHWIICRNGAVGNATLQFRKTIWSALFAGRKQALLSFFTLATGVFIVFSVGLNRQDFADVSRLDVGTGGYTLWCESSVPVYHNINTPEGKKKLALTDLPTDAEVLQMLRYSADDASCLNLNKVSRPTVLGVDTKALSASHFEVNKNIWDVDKQTFFNRMRQSDNGVYPVLVDATVLTWGLGLKLGDTLTYDNDKGNQISLLLAGTLGNSIFQGNLIMDKQLFSEAWQGITGSELMLVKVPSTQGEEVKQLMSQALADYGVRVTPTAERLKEFNSVTDTYLTIFMTLGGLGLLLGIIGFVIVVRKNLAAHKTQIAIYRTLGFPDFRIEKILYHENIAVPLFALGAGIVGALTGVGANIANIGIGLWMLALALTGLFWGCLIFFIKLSVRQCIQEK